MQFHLSYVVGRAPPPVLDLLTRCLQYDPAKRISAAECLQHPCLLQETSQNQTRVKDAQNLHHIVASSEQTFRINTTPPYRALLPTNIPTNSPEVEKYNHPLLVNLQKTTLQQHSFLRNLEITRDILPPVNVLLAEHEWSFDVRARMATWVIDITSAYDPVTTCQRTAFYALALMDAYYARCLNASSSGSGTKTHETHLREASASFETIPAPSPPCAMELVGACCMHIASKCEDVSYIGIRDLANSLPNGYESGEFLLVEEEVLNVFQFDLYLPTVIDFLGLYMDCLPELTEAVELQSFCQYLAMCTLLCTDFNGFEPSRISAAIVSYALSYKSDGSKNTTAVVWVSA